MLTLQTSKPFYTSFLCIQAVPGVKSSCRNRKDGPELCFIQAQALASYTALSNSHNQGMPQILVCKSNSYWY